MAVAFLLGFLCSYLFGIYLESRRMDAYKNAMKKRLDFDPYLFDKQSRSASDFFFTILPLELRKLHHDKFAEYKIMASCEADLIPGGRVEVITSIKKQNELKIIAGLLSFEGPPDERVKIQELKNMDDASELDFFELHCNSGSTIIHHPSFKPLTENKDLLSWIGSLNRPVLSIKLRSSDTFAVLAYNPISLDFEFIGNYSKSL